MSESGAFSEKTLATVPVKNGFRQRGVEMTRLETFTDAAFAFAVTLLVVGGGDSVPQNFDELSTALTQIPAFAASFANIMWFWFSHHVWSRRFGLEDAGAIFLSLLLVLVVLVYIYPLKALYSGAIDFLSGGYFESYFAISSLADLRELFVVFGTAYLALSTMIALLYLHALHKRAVLNLNAIEIFDSISDAMFWAYQAIIGLISVLLAIFLPGSLIAFAGIWYVVIGVVAHLHAWHRDRLRKHIQ